MSDDKINMNHGAGGEVMANLISSTILDNITNKSVNGGISLDALDDGASIPLGDYEIVMTTDGHTIDPLFFPGGDIGRISAAGTINDVSVMGAKPLAISNAIIMQEGFPIEDLDKIMKSLNEACEEVDVAVITGDTKVMPQDKLDGIVMVTTGIGIAKKGEVVRDSGLEVGDKIIITGSLGDHGMSLMSFREGFGFDTDLKSDVAPMWNIIKKALDVGGVTAMKDPTRGGFANAINEMASKSGNGIVLEQDAIPIRDEVHAVSEMLGIDPFEVANEGKVVMGVKADKAEEVLEAIKSEKYGENAAIIGEVVEGDYVIVNTPIGGERILEALFTRRVIAYFIDFFVVSAFMWIISFLLSIFINPHGTFQPYNYLGYIVPIIGLIYFVYLEKTKQATVGKSLMYLQVVSRNGYPITWIQAIVRNLTKIFWFPIIFDWVLGKIFKSNDRLFGSFTKTMVVNEIQY